MSVLQRICLVLTIIGAINWGLVGFFQYDFVTALFGQGIARFIFAIVGIAGLINIGLLFVPNEERSRSAEPRTDRT